MVKRTDKIEIGMDVAVRCRVTNTWQDDLGDQWATVLIDGYDLPITLKATHFFPVDDSPLVGCQRGPSWGAPPPVTDAFAAGSIRRA